MILRNSIRLLVLVAVASGICCAQKAPARAKATPQKSAAPASPAKSCPTAPSDTRPIVRLIMKDGSYQPMSKCELLDAGKRVHYLSAERYTWEDIPAELVDWAATDKFSKEGGAEQTQASADAAAVDAEEAAERRKEDAQSPLIKPGLKLPAQGGIYLLDYWRDQPQLVELVQNGSDINKNTGRNILRAAINPLAKARQTVELRGAHARVQAHVPEPVLYVNIDMDQDPNTGPEAKDVSRHFRIVRADLKKDARVVGVIEVAMYGKVSQKANYIDTIGAPLNDYWVKITPAEPLPPGEYALVEMLGKDVNLYVWDFGVNPTAPRNDTAWRPTATTDTSTGTRESPVLNKRPKK